MGTGLVTLLACGDVMPGRGIDQIRPHPGDPELRDFGQRGLRETLGSLAGAALAAAKAGLDSAQARRPVGVRLPDRGRALVFCPPPRMNVPASSERGTRK